MVAPAAHSQKSSGRLGLRGMRGIRANMIQCVVSMVKEQ
jgi:hypothetical protein